MYFCKWQLTMVYGINTRITLAYHYWSREVISYLEISSCPLSNWIWVWKCWMSTVINYLPIWRVLCFFGKLFTLTINSIPVLFVNHTAMWAEHGSCSEIIPLVSSWAWRLVHNGVQAEQSSAKKIISQSIVKGNCFENQSASIIVIFALRSFSIIFH